MEFDDNWKDLNIIINFYQSSLVRTTHAKLSYTLPLARKTDFRRVCFGHGFLLESVSE